MTVFMRKLFTHENRLIVYNLKNLLEEQGIDCKVSNEFSAGGAGDLAPFDTWPELWVIDDRDEARARQIIQQLQQAADNEITCPHCGEVNAGSFRLCWNCGGTLEP